MAVVDAFRCMSSVEPLIVTIYCSIYELSAYQKNCGTSSIEHVSLILSEVKKLSFILLKETNVEN